MTWNEFRCPANLALFLPFSCNQSLQLSAYACKASGAQLFEDTS
jgi:hypothetical protein